MQGSTVPGARAATLKAALLAVQLCVCMGVFMSFSQTARADDAQPAAADAGIYQLRIYEIFESNKAAFHARFRDHALRIMARYGFEIISLWESRNGEKTEFVYLIKWPDTATMHTAWKKLMADQEWSAIKVQSAAEHGALVGEIQEKVMRLTDYSPLPLSRPRR